MGYKAPLIETLELMEKDKKESGRLRSHLEYDSILQQALEDKYIIDNKQVDREEVGEFYLRGFTSGEVLSGYDGTLSKQGLYNKAEKIDERYQESHKEKRGQIQERVDKYFFYDRPNLTGTLEEVRKRFQGRGYSSIYEEYMNQGGLAPKYDEQLKSDSMYLSYYPQLVKGERPKGVSERRYKAMLAGFYRYRKESVDRAIILGKLEDIQWLEPSEEYVLKRQIKVAQRILGLSKVFTLKQDKNPTEANILVYIESEMEVYGKVARDYYKDIILDSKLEQGILEDEELQQVVVQG